MTKKNKTPVDDRPFLYVKCPFSEYGGEICSGQENDSWPSYEDRHREYAYEYATRTKPTGNDLFLN